MIKPIVKRADVWAAIDEIARRQDTTLSRLALDCGLSSTTFNKSKRKKRWPAMRTVFMILFHCGLSFHDFARIMDACSIKRQEDALAEKQKVDL